jgi:hypothetical protein
MSDATSRRPVPDYQGATWASGLSVFAASLMMVLGVFQFFEGLVAVVDGNDFLLNTKNYVVQFDASTWGWTHLILGVVVAATGLFILTGNAVARGVGVAIVSLSALANFLWIPYYPLWALTVLALDVAVIWALTSANLGDR